ncbi:hypothetical protein B7R54_03200 [Subtercola boreus]|uniref:Septum formation-related domain-containing protein n=1 Tax=Subtercola boreus TaxID=120213 RepID=A0A3E0VEK3_9MICO|nr:membrane lipoprotein lipid attachment site-containing protein [Subtercola boreus]RFA08342.1 hypothetical protein B7R54_03200 [Subtercola boreus]
MKKALVALVLVFALAGCTEAGVAVPSTSDGPAATQTTDVPTTEGAAPPVASPSSEAAVPPASTGDAPAEVVPGPAEPGAGGWTPELVFSACTGALDKAYDPGSLKSRADLDQSDVTEVTEGIWSVVIPVVRSDTGDGQQGCTVQGTVDAPMINVTDYDG